MFSFVYFRISVHFNWHYSVTWCVNFICDIFYWWLYRLHVSSLKWTNQTKIWTLFSVFLLWVFVHYIIITGSLGSLMFVWDVFEYFLFVSLIIVSGCANDMCGELSDGGRQNHHFVDVRHASLFHSNETNKLTNDE